MNRQEPTISNAGGLPPSQADLLTQAFYRWEQLGRGWLLFPHPVAPEPPFRPFSGHSPPDMPCVDDGRRPTVLSAAIKAAGRMFRGRAADAPPAAAEEATPTPEPFVRERLVEVQVLPPLDFDAKEDAFAQFLLGLALCREPVVFELVATAPRITVQFCLHPGDEAHLRAQLQSFFPDAGAQKTGAFLANAWQAAGGAAVIGEWGLRREFMCPLGGSDADLFVPLMGALSDLRQGEAAVFQVLLQPVRHPWAESILAAASDGEGGSFFVNAPEFLKQAREKVSRPLSAAVVRAAVKSNGRSWELMRQIASALQTVGSPTGNELMPLPNDGYPPAAHEEDLLRRQSRRPGMIINVGELAGFVHLPTSEVRSPKLARQTVKTKAAPHTVGSGLLLGHNTHAGKTVPVFLGAQQRSMHCHIVGASGTGKSTLLYNLIRQDLENGEGVAVLDPHGDLIDQVIAAVPEARINDVILFDPSDAQYSIGFNILSAHGELEKRLLASDLVAVFRRLSTSWGDQMNAVLQNGVLAFLASDRGGTLADLRRFLLEPAFRNEFLETVSDPEVQYYWHRAFPQLSGNKSIGPILTRLETFLSPKTIRLMVSQKENRFDFADIMDSGKVFLAKLAQGLVGRENAFLLGSILVAKFQQLAMSRQAQAVAARRRFWVYIDEAHNFLSPSLGEVLSETRKYSVGLILAHQDLRQLERDAEVAGAVLGNVSTRICFRLGDADAKKLSEGFSFFEARDLQNLGTGEAVCRIGRSDCDFNLSVPLPAPVEASVARDRLERIRAHSRATYATPSTEVERQLAASRGHVSPAPAVRLVARPATVANPEPPAAAPGSRTAAALSDLDLRYLQAVITNPGLPSRAYAKLARVSGERALAIRRRLAAKGFLREHTVSTGRRGPPALVLEPLPAAFNAATTAPTP